MKVGVPKETYPGEKRVALVPFVIPSLSKAKLEVVIESGAGNEAGFSDGQYQEKGAGVIGDRAQLFRSSDILLQVRGFSANPERGAADLPLLHENHVVVALLDPLIATQEIKKLADRKVTAFAMELIPRIARAQSMDVLSSMATIAGYKAVLLAADSLPKMFPMMMTAAGTIAPAHAFVIGAGVAGLQAIATARRLGAVVQAYDLRPAVKEQVESLGAKFVELDLKADDAETKGGYARAMDEEFYRRQREMMTRVVAESDIVISTAAVPGKKAPVLLTAEMIRKMKPGSVVVDLAAEQGGNCEVTKPGETIVEEKVTIIGPLNIPSMIPYHSSQMYAKNISNFLLHLVKKEGNLDLSRDDEIVRHTLVTRGGVILNEEVRKALGGNR